MKKQTIDRIIGYLFMICFVLFLIFLVCGKAHAQSLRYVYPDTGLGGYTITIIDTVQKIEPSYRLLWQKANSRDSSDFGMLNFKVLDATPFIPDWDVLIPTDTTIFWARCVNPKNSGSISGLSYPTVIQWLHVESTVPPIPDTTKVVTYYVATTEQLSYYGDWVFNETGACSVRECRFSMWGYNTGNYSTVIIRKTFALADGYYNLIVSVCAWPLDVTAHIWLAIDGDRHEIKPDNRIFYPYTVGFSVRSGLHTIEIIAERINLVFEASNPASGVYPLLLSKQADFPPFRPLRVTIQRPN